jgi:hypothetical protein
MRYQSSGSLLSSSAPLLLCGAVFSSILHAGIQSPQRRTSVLLGRVLDAGTERPVPGAIVSVNSQTSDTSFPRTASGGVQPRHTMTTTDGDFIVQGLDPGRYAITALAFGYSDIAVPVNIVEVTATDRFVRVTLHVWKYAAISGQVVDDSGEPIAGVPVSSLLRVSLGGALVLRQASVKALTDDRGIYRLSNLAPGSYIVGVLSSPMTLPVSLVRELDAAANDPQMAMALSRSLLPGGGRVESTDGLRAGDVVMQLSPPLAPPTPEGRLQVYPTVLYPGVAAIGEALPVTVSSGQEHDGVDLMLRARPAFRVSGRVVGPGDAMSKIAIRLLGTSAADRTDLEPGGAATAITDASGKFTFLGVAPGQYALTGMFVRDDPRSSDSALWVAQPLVVGESDIDDLALTMRPGARVSGRVEFTTAGSGSPDATRFRVHLRPIGAQSWRPSQGPVGADWTFHTGGEPPGRYVANISSPPGWTLQSMSVRGESNPDAVIDLGIDDVPGLVYMFSNRPSQVTGTVSDANSGTTFVDVIVFPADTSFWREGIFNSRRVSRVRASSSGSFAFPSLMLGDYYAVAVGARLTVAWEDPAFLERLIPGASKFSLKASQDTTLSLKSFAPRER